MSEDFVVVETFMNIYEADVAKLYLEGEGIPAVLQDANVVNFDWFLSTAVGHIKLCVPASFEAGAKALLVQWRPSFKLKAELQHADADDAPLTCLSCGGEMAEDEAACASCGWSYDACDDAERASEG